MAEPDRRRAVTTRVIWILIGVFFITMVASQLVIRFYNPIRTEVAALYTTTESIGFKGFYVRDERLVSYRVNGVISYTHPDGSKIAKNSVIAEVYGSQADLALQQEIADLTAQRDVLEDAQALVGADQSQLESFSNQIYSKHAEIMQCLYDGDFRTASSLKSDMLNLQSKREIIKGTETSYAAKIANIDSEIARLRSKITSEPAAISIDEAGYFVSTTDGYENVLNSATVFDLSREQIETILADEGSRPNPSGVIGKLIDGYKWYLVAKLDTIKLGTVFESAEVTLRLGSSLRNVRARIVDLRRQEDGSSICIFECDTFSSDFADSRVTQVKLLLDSYQGIRIPTEAIRMDDDGNMGVYTQNGVQVVFKRIRQMMSEEDYTLVENTSGQDGFISLYDTIIVSGKDLHDGKIIA